MRYPTFTLEANSQVKELTEHLKSWGLRRFSDETSYYQWQKETLADEEIALLNRLGLTRSAGEQGEADRGFYDLAAQENILPVLYSQRYDYFLEVGCAMTNRIEPAHRVLDFGCGVGILTTFYACRFPQITFLGIDRSPGSIARAKEEAARRGISNVQFEIRHIPNDTFSDSFDLIISTQTLFQAEKDPGLPSLSWTTFERAGDSALQVQVEFRTGLKDRLDCLSQLISSGGRMLLCEKAWHLGRRILLQRALASRGYRLVGEPVVFRYQAIDEVVQDGPLFEVSQDPHTPVWSWDEEATVKPGESLYGYQGDIVEELVSSLNEAEIIQTVPLGGDPQQSSTVTFARWRACLAYGFVKTQSGFRGLIIGSVEDENVIRQYFLGAERWTDEQKAQVMAQLWPQSEGQGDEAGFPSYESHTAIAQKIWDSLPDRHLHDQATFREQDGREMHIEWGTSGPLTFMYWANTYDQRQLVLMTHHRAKVLHHYYQESLSEMKGGSHS
jgi:SAM-dependent methyltransferase